MNGTTRKLLAAAVLAALPSLAWAQQEPRSSGAGEDVPAATDVTPSDTGADVPAAGDTSRSGTGDELPAAGSAAPGAAGSMELAPAPAQAEIQPAMPAPAPAPAAQPAWEHARRPRTSGVEALANVGVLNFPGMASEQLTSGLAYGAGVSLMARQGVGLELGYQGATYGTRESLAGPREAVAENGGQALLKVGPHLAAVEPYLLGGYNLTRINVVERAGAAGAVRDDTVSKVPVGAGVDFRIPATRGGLMVGARSTYNFLFGDQAFSVVADNPGTRQRSADQLITTLDVGGHF